MTPHITHGFTYDVPYNYDPEREKKYRNSKGFAHSLITHRASDKFSSQIRTVMRRAHREYIVVRGKKRDSAYHYTAHNIGIHKFYIATAISTTKAIDNFRAAVRTAQKQLITRPDMVSIINHSCDQHDKVANAGNPTSAPSAELQPQG